MGLFSKYIGIDLGTANILVYVKGKGVVIRESSIVAVDRKTNKLLAVGNDAKLMLGRTPSSISAVRPLKDGVISDFETTQIMLKYFIKESKAKGLFGKPDVIICVPSGVTSVEKKAVEEASYSAGVKHVYLIEEPMAAAIGAGLSIEDPTGVMVVDIGGGTSEIAVISMGGIVTSRSLRIAGDALDEDIVNYMRKEHNLMIGDKTAEDIKLNIGCAVVDSENIKSMNVSGRDILTGLPKDVTVTSTDINTAIKGSLDELVDAIKATLEKAPPEISADIITQGIVLTGGGALLEGLDQLIKESIDVEVRLSETPLDCVAIGTGKVIEEMDSLKKVLIPSKK